MEIRGHYKKALLTIVTTHGVRYLLANQAIRKDIIIKIMPGPFKNNFIIIRI